jgi:hypothetical protein
VNLPVSNDWKAEGRREDEKATADFADNADWRREVNGEEGNH